MTNEQPRVLLVGAGAVGQVFAHYLRSAGCAVTFLVKEKHAAQARAGFTLYELGVRQRTPAPTPLSGFGVLVSEREVQKERWDQVWLCVSSTALRSGEGLKKLAASTGDATWVMLQPALDDREWLLQWIPAERLVTGMIPFLAFHAPLTPEDALKGPGTAFWMPPLSRGLFSGPSERLWPLLRTLRAGGFPVKEDADVTRAASIPSAMLCAAVLGLEAVGWSFERLLRPESLERTLGAAREAARIAEWATGASPASLLPLLRPVLIKASLALATRVAPVDLETFLRVHFTKVGEQTRLMLRTYLAMGQSAGLDTPHLQALAPPDLAAKK
ncbi:ketopantoate reductase family protein [Melittangium boletus]|uniref:Ketopantoate reductase PanE/ApbA family n=1 Tax=Melittangium boletus DSM 14713 TaxID=1294270 RepID=A0A250IGN4_9BACT|nr:2-dehydropantoate 2-reductase N-terminal domain-containing protein [Melittangium boletus]ATB30428.1 ketopantoate reductase PanE/ApbA family [Melittangium boletus DSM 14713]